MKKTFWIAVLAMALAMGAGNVNAQMAGKQMMGENQQQSHHPAQKGEQQVQPRPPAEVVFAGRRRVGYQAGHQGGNAPEVIVRRDEPLAVGRSDAGKHFGRRRTNTKIGSPEGAIAPAGVKGGQAVGGEKTATRKAWSRFAGRPLDFIAQAASHGDVEIGARRCPRDRQYHQRQHGGRR